MADPDLEAVIAGMIAAGGEPGSADYAWANAALTTQDCPDDAPDGTCWDCGAHRSRPHREDCATRQEA